MIAHFPSPVLSVAADVIQGLEGEDALYSLWALFTKCKESLKDGRRLENISWRLWYREIAAQQSLSSSSYNEKRCASPITPVSEHNDAKDLLSPTLGDNTADGVPPHSWHGDVPMVSTPGRRLSTASAPFDRSGGHASVAVGRFIIDILPGKVQVPEYTRGTPTQMPRLHAPPLAQPRPVVSITVPGTPPAPTPVFPRVIVVNPTPHPTPPATPSNARGPATQHSAQTATHLAPPPLASTLIAAPAPLTHVKPSVMPATRPGQSSQHTASPARDLRACGDDATLKPSDRRFFLQEAAESPDRDSLDGGSRPADVKSEDGHARSASSAASSNISNVGGKPTGCAPKRGAAKGQGRKSKETLRHAPVRPMASHRPQTQAHRERQAAQRKAANGDAKKTTFNIGSTSSNGSRNGNAGPPPVVHTEVPATRPQPQPEPQRAANGTVAPSRRPVAVSTSSDYSTETDDSEWASEDNSADEREREARKREELRLREAAEEAQRQRDMFAKAPRRSYSNLNRTQSGLLSQLLNPDPHMFPPTHPYSTRGVSSQDMSQLRRQAAPHNLPASKGSVAVPMAAAVVARVAPTNGATTATARPKGRPQSAELEEDSDSEDENPDNAIQVPHSLAQKKLAALADPNRRRNSDHGPPPSEAAVRPQIPSVATAPIALGHPYNLPAPAPPMTPRTTRRQMLATELSESLRRNLLWERQVSRNNLTRRGGGVLGSNLRPLTAMHSNSDSSRNGGSGSKSGNESDDRRKANVARNRSWADDYHYAGW